MTRPCAPPPARDAVLHGALVALSIAAIVAGSYLAFKDLAMTGLTWDEWGDYGIAVDFVRNHAFLENRIDPSQGRFAHLIAAGSFALLGISYLSFKLPFVIIGLLGGVGLWLFLRPRVRPAVALFVAAMYFSCPYVLAASRTGATAGDVLVCTLGLAFIVTLCRWMTRDRFWPDGVLCAVVCGAATGAKWTCAPLLIGAVIGKLVANRQRGRSLLHSATWTALFAQWWLVCAVAVITCPTLLLGLPFVQGAYHHATGFDPLEMVQFGTSRAGAPWYYIPAVLVSKISPVQLLVFLWAVAAVIACAIRRRKTQALSIACLVSLLPVLLFVYKGFQNAQYYLPFVPVVMIMTATTLDEWLDHRWVLVRRAALVGAGIALAAQVALAIRLSPDYLQAGRQFGTLLQGQFGGPAVNHCQGIPFAIRDLNRLVEAGGPRRAYNLMSCKDVVPHASSEGPVHPLVPIELYPASRPPDPHYLLILSIYDYDSTNARERREQQSRKLSAISSCRLVARHVDYRIYACEGV